MIDKTIDEIEAEIRAAQSLDQARKTELLEKLEQLRTETLKLAQAGGDSPGQAGDFVRTSSVGRIQERVRTFERSHPVLTVTVNDFCTFFANFGI